MRAKPWEHPTKTSSTPRRIPPQPWYLHNVQRAIITGLAPFAVLFIELLFVFKNLWQDKSGYYYVFGFLSAVTTILMITVSEVTVIATYSQLCAEVGILDLAINEEVETDTVF
jgi:transmembrane 9 superfamily protein 2/4